MRIDITKTKAKKGKTKIYKQVITIDKDSSDKIIKEINNIVNRFDVVGVLNNLIDKMSKPIFINLKGESYGERE